MTFDYGTVGYGATPHVHLFTRRVPGTEATVVTSAPGSCFPVVCRPGQPFRCVRASTGQLREAAFMHRHALAPCLKNIFHIACATVREPLRRHTGVFWHAE